MILKKHKQAKEEYEKIIKKVQEDELKSDRFKMTYDFLEKNYWNRENESLEKELFKILEFETMIDKSYIYEYLTRLKRYNELKSFMSSLNDEQINSNIFLKNAYIFMDLSLKDCLNLIYRLIKRIRVGYLNTSLRIEYNLLEEIPKYMTIQISNKMETYSHKSLLYKTKKFDILDESHKYIYENYNECVNKINKLLESIYLLKLNSLLYRLTTDIICSKIEVSYSGSQQCLYVTFLSEDISILTDFEKRDNEIILKKILNN